MLVVAEAGHIPLLAVDRCGQEGKTGSLPSTPRAKMCCTLSLWLNTWANCNW